LDKKGCSKDWSLHTRRDVMKNQKDVTVIFLTEKEKEVAWEMIEYIKVIENWEWGGIPVFLAMFVSAICTAGVFTCYSITRDLVMYRMEVITLIGGFLVLLAIFIVMLFPFCFLLYHLFFKQLRNKKIERLNQLYKNTPEAKSALEKIRVFFEVAEGFKEFNLASCEHIRISLHLKKLVAYNF